MSGTDLRLGIYRLGAELGRGGMGTVYRAVSEAAGPAGPEGAVVAVKVFHPHLASDERAFERFQREARIGGQISHAHIVRTFDFGVQEAGGESFHYMVMELVEGQTLAGLLDELGTVPEDLCHQIADQVLEGLHAIHEHGVVHRDIKPENIVITPDHRVLLMDLGVARMQETGHTLTGAGEFVGSVAYAAPEQFVPGEDVIGPPADLYAFGLVLLALLTGRKPFSDSRLHTILSQKLHGEVPPPRTVSPDLDPFWSEVIVTATRRKVAERFDSAAEMRRILQEGEAGDWWRTREDRVGQSIAGRALKRLQLAREAPLVGRAPVLERLHGAWEQAREQGGSLLLGGRSGVGKSRVLYEFLEEITAGEGTAVAAGRCAGAEGRSYQPFVEALGDLLLPLDASPAARRAALVERLGELLADTPGVVAPLADALLGGLQEGREETLSKDAFLAACTRVMLRLAEERPLLVVVEDLQLAGPETIELFRYVARSAPEHALLLVGVYTDEDVEDGTPLHELVTTPPSAGRGRIDLAPLGERAAEELVRAVVRIERTVRSLARPLHQRSEGNAFLLLEMLAQLQADGALVEKDGQGLALARPVAALQTPSTVRDVVSLKLSRLDDEQRETLEASAVLGHEFDAPLLAAVLDENRIHLLKRLAVLERRHRLLVAVGKGAYRFAGHHVFEAVYDAISPDLREAYHGLVADTILSMVEGEDEPDGATCHALLHHLFHAGRTLEATPYLEGALGHLAAAFHASHAVPFLERVAEAFQGAPPEKRIAIALKQWTFYELLASRTDQMRVLETAHDLAEQLGDQGLRAHVHALRAGSWWYAGDYAKATEEAETGLELARAAGDRKWESACLHTLGAIAFRQGDPRTCTARMREALAIRREIGDRRGEASTLQALGLVMPAVGEDAAVLETMEEALRIWREIGERRGEAAVLMNIGNRLLDAGRHAEGQRRLEEAIANHRETGALVSEAMALANLGRAHEMQGRPEDARASWNRALALFTDLGDPHGEMAVRTMLASALVTRKVYGQARRHLERTIELAEGKGAKAKLVSALCELGRLETETGDPGAARTHLERALAVARETGSRTARVQALSGLGVALLAAGDARAAVSHLEEALPDARAAASGPGALLLARYARALRVAGREEEARTVACEAQDRLRAAGETGGAAPPQGMEVFRLLAEVLGEEGCCAEVLARVRAMDRPEEPPTDATAVFVPKRDPDA